MLDINIDLTKYKKKVEKGVMVYMCKAWDDHKESGRLEGLQQGLQQLQEEQKSSLNSLVNILSTIYSDFESIYNKIISDEKYSNITREQVLEVYNIH